MNDILAFVASHWVEWLFAGLLALLTYGYQRMDKRLKEEREKNAALIKGVQALLRGTIVADYNKYSEKGFMPIYAKESLKRAYEAYSALGGNDVASELYNKMLKMPEEKKKSLIQQY